MVGNGLTQLHHAPVGKRQQKLCAVIQHHFPLQTAPNGEGKLLRTNACQIQQELPLLLRLFRLGWGRGISPFHRFHKIAHLLLGADVSFRQELIVGRFHGDFADLQILRQRPFGRKLRPGLQGAFQNIPADTAVEGFVQGNARGFFQFVSYHITALDCPSWHPVCPESGCITALPSQTAAAWRKIPWGSSAARSA